MADDQEVDLKNRDSFTVWSEVTIRFSDEDSLGHVNNVATAQYVEVGRNDLFQSVLGAFDIPDLDFVLANVNINYHQEFHYPGVVEVGSCFTRIGNKSVTSGYGIFKDGVCMVTATSVNVFFDLKTRVGVTPPPEIKQALQAAFGK